MGLRKLGEFDPARIAEELGRTRFWNWLQLRKADGLQHSPVDDIVLRFQSVEGLHNVTEYFDKLECVDYFPQGYLPHTMQLVRRIGEGRTVGRVVVAKMMPLSWSVAKACSSRPSLPSAIQLKRTPARSCFGRSMPMSCTTHRVSR